MASTTYIYLILYAEQCISIDIDITVTQIIYNTLAAIQVHFSGWLNLQDADFRINIYKPHSLSCVLGGLGERIDNIIVTQIIYHTSKGSWACLFSYYFFETNNKLIKYSVFAKKVLGLNSCQF